MKLIKNKYIVLVCILFLAAAAAEGFVYMNYGKLQEQPVMLGRFLRIYPIYNDDGSWLHGRLGIGYVRGLLVLEDILSFLVEVFLIRYISSICDFFSISRKVLMAAACAMAATFYRFFTRLRGVYVLDYLHVRGRGVFDLPDLYLFLTMVGIILWIVVPYYKAYHPFKKEKVKGMPLLQKWALELRFAGIFLQAAFLPKDRWEKLFEKWR